MLSKFTLSKRAEQDIEEITQHSLQEFGVHQTENYMAGMKSALELLADNPSIGRAFAHGRKRKTYHHHRYISHSVFYRWRKHDIFILRILHSRMLPEKHLG